MVKHFDIMLTNLGPAETAKAAEGGLITGSGMEPTAYLSVCFSTSAIKVFEDIIISVFCSQHFQHGYPDHLS